ncbi:MAG TPA: hypothetical protein VM869_26330, partial [Enhygromyxa sp.]|nr:hypothetical protein [Enhygromyxa sp.]
MRSRRRDPTLPLACTLRVRGLTRHRSPTAFHVEDAGRVEIEIELEADIWSLYSERCMWAAGFARHLLAGNHPREI